jgi:very-short-patch-repair endonuclease
VKIETLLASGGPVFHLPSLPEVARTTVRSAYAAGRLVRLLPGTYVPTELKDDLMTRCMAVGWWNPDAVIVGAAAARLTFWPDLPVRQIDVARRGPVPTGRGYRFHRRNVEPWHIIERGGLRVTRPAVTAIELVAELGGDPIDTCLRSRTARLSDLWEAYQAFPARPGNGARRRMLHDSRDKPWSAAERLAHRILRRAHLLGWKANHDITVDGALYFIDIAFLGAKIAVEIDGRLHEDDPLVFENDRLRQNALVRSGWRVLRFTYAMLVDDPEYVIEAIRVALAQAGRG